MKKNEKLIILNVILLLVKILFISSYIVLPFNYNKYDLKDITKINEVSGNVLSKYLFSYPKTQIQLGDQNQKLLCYITTETWMFYLSKHSWNEEDIKTQPSTYTPENSKTYSNSTFTSYAFRDIRNATIGQDTFFLYDNINLKSTIALKNFNFIYGDKFTDNTNTIQNICGTIGINIPNNIFTEYKDNYFLKELNNKDIGNYSFTFDFNHSNKNNDGLLIFGAEDNNYLKLYSINSSELDYHYSYSVSGSGLLWQIYTRVLFEYKNITNNTIETFSIKDQIFTVINIDANYVFLPKKLYNVIKEKIFDTYINQNICYEVKTIDMDYAYKYIYCDKESFKDKTNFVSISMPSFSYNTTFTLNNDDLFMETDDKYIFLGFYDYYNYDLFIVGKLFLKKYQFIFNTDKKQIAFLTKKIIDDNDKISDNNNNIAKYILIVIGIIIFIGGISLGVYLGKKVYLNRKKRANELTDDDFEYSANKENNENNDNKLIN